MEKLSYVVTGLLFFFCCTESYEDSKVEVIKYDRSMLQAIQSTYDTMYTEWPKRSDWWSIDYYISDSTLNKIMKDSLGNIVGIVRVEGGKRTFVEEYYSNGQLRVKNNFPSNSFDGPITSYYSNGQIESTGQWKDMRMVGKWMYYDSEGKLKMIEYYGDDGDLLEKKEIK